MLDIKHHAKFAQKQHSLDAYEKKTPTCKLHGNALVTPETPDKPASPTKMPLEAKKPDKNHTKNTM